MGLIFSESGTMKTSEQPLKAATLVAIDEINASGGILGRPVQAITRDGASDPAKAAYYAEHLIKDDGVVALFACWTSTCRKAVMRVVEQLHSVLFYPVQYEGTGLGELPRDPSPQVVYSGAAPNQQLVPAALWALERKPRARVFLVGSDYVFPRSANALLRAIVLRHGGSIVGEAYQPLGSGEFRGIVSDIERAHPDVIFNTVNGLDNSTLFNELSRLDATGDRYLTISFSVDENLTDEIGWGHFVGRYSAWNYFHDPDNERAKDFLPRFRARLASEAARTSDPVEAAYLQTNIFALAARRANSVAPNEVLRAARGLVVAGFAGLVRVDPGNQNLWKRAVIGRFNGDRRLFEPVWTSEYPVRPQEAPEASDPELMANSGFGPHVASMDEARDMLASSALAQRIGALAYLNLHTEADFPAAQVARSLTSAADWTERYLAARSLLRNGSSDAQHLYADGLRRAFDDNDALLLLSLFTQGGDGLHQPLQTDLADAVTAAMAKSTDPVVRRAAIDLLSKYPAELAGHIEAVMDAGSRGDASVAVSALQAFQRLPAVSAAAALLLRPILQRPDVVTAPSLADNACNSLSALGAAWEKRLPRGGIAAYRQLAALTVTTLGAGTCTALQEHANAIERRAISEWLATHQPDSLTGWLALMGAGVLGVFVLIRLVQFALVLANPGRFMRSVRPFRPVRMLGLDKRFPEFAEFVNFGGQIAQRTSVLNRWITANREALADCCRAPESGNDYQPLLVEDEVSGKTVQRSPNDEYFASLLTEGGAAQILGEGGVGKTTLAVQLLRVALHTRVSGREVIPVLLRAHDIGDIEQHEAVIGALQTRMAEALREYRGLDRARQHELDDPDMILALTERGHLVVVIDDLTRSVSQQWGLATQRDFRSRFPLIFYTGRRPVVPPAAIARTVTPQPIDKAGLVNFVDTQLRTRGSGEMTDDEKHEIEERLEGLFAWRNRVPALFAQLIAQRVEAERTLPPAVSDVDISIPELVVSYVSGMLAAIPKDRAAGLDASQAWRALGALSWVCLEGTLSATAVKRDLALKMFEPYGEPDSILRAICDEARLAHRVGDDRVVIASDALAEYLAALWTFDASATERWEKEVEPKITQVLEFRSQSRRIDEPARTFLSALLDVAERAISTSSGPFEYLSASNGAIGTLGQWLELEGHTKPPIKVGVLFSNTGSMAISERQLQAATLLAIERVNARGGIRGRRLVAEIRDGSSIPAVFAQRAAELIQEDVVSIFGCWTSASRIEVLRVLERQGGLLFYPVQYEGYESSPNALYFGAAPNQQLLPAVDWCIDEARARRFLLIGSDYVFPRIANEILIARLLERSPDGAVLLRDPLYVDLIDPSFDAAFEAIAALQPEVILNTINGVGNLEFFWRLWNYRRRTGRELHVMSFSIGDHEAQRIGIEVTTGDYASWNYFSTLEGHQNSVFLRGMRGRKQVFFPSDPAEAAYTQVLAFAKAAEAVLDAGAEPLAPAAIRRAALGLELDVPSGRIRIDPDNGHVYKVPRIGRLEPDGTFKVIWAAADAVKPEPFPYMHLSERVRQIRAQLHPTV